MLQFITRPLSALLLAALCCQQAPLASAQSGDLSPQLPSDLKQCSTVDLTWSATTNNGSSQMYYASIVSASARGLNGTDEVITYLARLNDTTNYEWQVGVQAGSNISLKITDSAGNLGYSSAATVQEGDSSCLPTGLNDDNTISNTPAAAPTSSQATGPACSLMLEGYMAPKILAALALGTAVASLVSL
ncbi:hypothetical protein P389DRAFT_178173 [Cystobasidium minutum MCA 4210]|uniref:uncharacterized protein n=1 Tax=Cystobasidium minutum MCA 4210 TaxID=1397322 RepID=UPI0034CF5027|eukprot:jgi/Rhomi1/178173/fgenesh1_pg.2_\